MFTRKKIILFLLIAAALMATMVAWRIFGSNTTFTEQSKALYIKSGSSFSRVENLLQIGGFVDNQRSFKVVARLLNYRKNVRPGRYVIQRGASIFDIIRLLKSGRQTPVNFTITKLRTRKDLAQKIAASFDCNPRWVRNFLNSNDSLAAWNLDTNSVMTAVIPNTYSIFWTTPFEKVFERLRDESKRFWNAERKAKAAALGLTPEQCYTLASIVEEETNMQDDKGKIASVYLNRMAKGMALGADPTVKFALNDFGLKRIYEKHLQVVSPYNTYRIKGLPPGPICTPSVKTIDAVLDAPATNYLYFVAKPDFNGYSNFATTYEEHLRFARAYQQALDTLMRRKAEGRE